MKLGFIKKVCGMSGSNTRLSVTKASVRGAVISFIAAALLSPNVNAKLQPVFAVNKDSVCGIYGKHYSAQLNRKVPPSFATEEVITHKDNSSYKPTDKNITPITFSSPFTEAGVTWLQWLPLANVQHSFEWGGTATRVTALGSIKPSATTSYILQVNTIGWRGPFYRVWLIDDRHLEQILQGVHGKEGEDWLDDIPLEDSGAKLVFPEHERSFRAHLTNLFQYNHHFYTATDDQVFKVTSGTSEPVCKLGLETDFVSPQLQALERAANQALMTKGMGHIPTYYGTMGNPHRYVKNGFATAIQKPWLIQTGKDGQCLVGPSEDHCEQHNRVEAVLNEFAQLDPWSYREIGAIRHHIAGAKRVLTDYYVTQLNVEKNKAQGMARQAIYHFLAQTVARHAFIHDGVEATQPAVNPYTLDQESGQLAANWFNKTELMWAAHFNDYDAIQRLLAGKVELDQVTQDSDDYTSIQRLNRSALTYATENASLAVIQQLLKAGAATTIKDSKGNGLDVYLNKNKALDMSWEAVQSADPAPINASFDCKRARSKQEKTICASAGLSIYDQQLGTLYKKVRQSGQYPEIKALQRRWLKALRTQCLPSGKEQTHADSTNCMKQAYRSRIKYLANLL